MNPTISLKSEQSICIITEIGESCSSPKKDTPQKNQEVETFPSEHQLACHLLTVLFPESKPWTDIHLATVFVLVEQPQPKGKICVNIWYFPTSFHTHLCNCLYFPTSYIYFLLSWPPVPLKSSFTLINFTDPTRS